MFKGFLACLPLAAGVAAYGLAFGLLAAQAGLANWEAGLMGLTVFAGASQFVAVERFASDGAVLPAIVAGLALNLRYIAVMASLQPILSETPKFLKPLAIHMTADENWALTIASRAKDRHVSYDFLIGAGMAIMIAWVASSFIGAQALKSLPDIETYGIGFSFIAAFIVLARSMWRGLPDFFPWITAFIVAVVMFKVTSASSLAILSGCAAGVAVGLMQPRSAKPLEKSA